MMRAKVELLLGKWAAGVPTVCLVRVPGGLHHTGIILGNHEWVVLESLGWLAAGAQGWADWPLCSAQDVPIGRPALGI